jgi:hypothetical protein
MRRLSIDPLWPAMAAAVGFFLWLKSLVPLVASGGAAYDDALFVKLADNILRGGWLGPYNELTLSKGPFLSVWIAAWSELKLPLVLSQSLLYAAAGWVFVVVLRPQVKHPWRLFIMFAAFLFNPLLYNLENLRVAREGLSAPLTVLVMAFAAGWLASQRRSGLRPWLWSGALGGALAAYWMTREEGLELAPALGVLAAAALLHSLRRKAARARPLLLAAAVAAVALAGVGVVQWRNHRRYGLWASVDLKQREYRAAYGALSRVLPEPSQRHVPVSRAALAKAAEASPALARLLPLFNPAWAQHGCWMEGMAACDGEYRGGWFRFALRDAAAKAGCYASAAAARDCYRRIDEEVNSACASGRLSCLPPRETWVPPWRARYAAQTARSLGRAVYDLVCLPTLSIRPGFSEDGPAFELFRRLVRGPLFPLKDRWTLRGTVVMDALLDGHLEMSLPRGTPYVTLQQAFGPLDLAHTQILFTLVSDCWDDSCAMVLTGRQGTLAKIPAAELLRSGEIKFARLRVLVKEASKQDMAAAAGYDVRRTERLFIRLRWLGNLYRILTPPVFLLALVFYARSLRVSFRTGDGSLLTALSTVLLAAVLSRLLLFSFIDAVSWPALNLLYFGPCYPLLILFCGTALCDVPGGH